MFEPVEAANARIRISGNHKQQQRTHEIRHQPHRHPPNQLPILIGGQEVSSELLRPPQCPSPSLAGLAPKKAPPSGA